MLYLKVLIFKCSVMVSSQQCAAMYFNNTIKDCILHRFPQNDAKRFKYT